MNFCNPSSMKKWASTQKKGSLNISLYEDMLQALIFISSFYGLVVSLSWKNMWLLFQDVASKPADSKHTFSRIFWFCPHSHIFTKISTLFFYDFQITHTLCEWSFTRFAARSVFFYGVDKFREHSSKKSSG